MEQVKFGVRERVRVVNPKLYCAGWRGTVVTVDVSSGVLTYAVKPDPEISPVSRLWFREDEIDHELG